MALSPQAVLGHYRIVEPIGKGGMGEVYRASDSKLARDVAIKVLPDAFAHDSERLARFRREAKLLASLNHPNIAGIHGLEETDGTHFLVLEYVPGETLADRITRGPLPVEEALHVAVRITEGLEEAHERGIVHRDLKPANVKLTPDDKVKILDFGLAKALVDEATEEDSATSMSPTFTRDATRVGVILGTASYMSPEQAKGKRVDKRTDVFAFGAVLYEMLTGKKAFPGEDVSEVLAAVIKSEPDWSALPTDLPQPIRTTLRRCLEKNHGRRLRDIGDAYLELGTVLESSDLEATARSNKGGALWAAASLVVILVAVSGLWLGARGATDHGAVTRLTVHPPPSVELRGNLALSPDGRTLAYAATVPNQLYKRDLDSWEATPLPEAAGYSLSFSPDSAWLAFSRPGQVLKAPLDGGSPIVLCTKHANLGSHWAENGRIAFGSEGQLWTVSENGGVPEALTELEEGWAQDPHWLPGGRSLLLAGHDGIEVLELESGARRILLEGHSPHYATSGHIVFARGARLWAVPFDAERLEPAGSPTPLPVNVRRSEFGSGTARFEVAADGTLAYVPSRAPPRATLVWVDADGQATPAVEVEDAYRYPRLSPDGRHVVVTVLSPDLEGSDLWLIDLERGSRTRLTDGGTNDFPAWSSDGERILFSSTSGEASGLYEISVDGTRSRTRLVQSAFPLWSDWSPDGSLLAFGSTNMGAGRVTVREGDGTTRLLERPSVFSWAPRFSPDGRYVAYVSNESGTFQIYVRSTIRDSDRWTISTGETGRVEPIWSRDGRTLFYRARTRGVEMWAVNVQTEPKFDVSTPQLLFHRSDGMNPGFFPNYDVAPDGRFLMVQEEAGEEPNEIRVVLGWFDELERLVPASSSR